MNKKTLTIIFSTITLLVITLITLLSFLLIPKSRPKLSENNLAYETQNSEHVVLTMGTATATAGGGISKNIKATITPETAVNKAVNWSISWGDTSKTEKVTDYVTVTPTSAESLEATITCYKAFAGDIVVTVTTIESGYSASCIVSYVGIPTDIQIQGPVNEKKRILLSKSGKNFYIHLNSDKRFR